MAAYVIFEDGGRQFKASVGDRILIDYRMGSETVSPVAKDANVENAESTDTVAENAVAATDAEEPVVDVNIAFEQVYAIRRDDETFVIGQPTVAGAVVRAKILGVEKGPKLVVQKFRRRKTFRKKTGHRQIYTLVEITAIEG